MKSKGKQHLVKAQAKRRKKKRRTRWVAPEPQPRVPWEPTTQQLHTSWLKQFQNFEPTEADALAVGPKSLKHWANFNWSATPLKSAPWTKGRLLAWLHIEQREAYGELRQQERQAFFWWWRWKRGIPYRVKSTNYGTVFYHDEIGRLRVFNPQD